MTDVVTWTVTTPPSCGPADLGTPFGALDIGDVIAFLAFFETEDELATTFAPPEDVADIADVVAFIQAFGEGCP